MRNLFIDLNNYFSKHKYQIGFIMLAVILFLMVTHEYNKFQREVGDSRANSTISESVSKDTNTVNHNNINQISTYEDVRESISEKEDIINTFYAFCSDGRVDIAYEMLTDDCKEILYPTLQDFEQNYYSAIFKTNKDIEITGFKNNTYKVCFYEEAITQGSKKNVGTTDYITVTKDNKLNISGFIERNKTNIKYEGSYFSTVINDEQVFVDYEIIDITINNMIKADIYMNDAEQSNLYIWGKDGKAYYIDSGNLFNTDYYVPSESNKNLKLKFNKKYDEDNKSISLYFGDIKIINKKYYDREIEKTTMYPETTYVSIDL